MSVLDEKYIWGICYASSCIGTELLMTPIMS